MRSTNDINFMRRRRRSLARLQEFDRQVFIGSLVFLSVSVFITLGTGVYWFYTRQQLALLNEQIAQQERVVKGSAKEEAEYMLYTTQLSALQKIFSERNPKKEALDFFAALLVPSISFDAVNYDTNEKRLTFRVEAQDVFSVETFLEKLREPGMNVLLRSVDISSVQRDNNGRYILNVDIVLQEGNK